MTTPRERRMGGRPTLSNQAVSLVTAAVIAGGSTSACLTAAPVAGEAPSAVADDTVVTHLATDDASLKASRNPARPMGRDYEPVVEPGDFVRIVDNPFLPLMPGMSYVYEADDERIEVMVTHENSEIVGVTTIEVLERSYVRDVLVEETREWFAQDRWGNVWYFGEDEFAVVDGQRALSADSWQAGVDGASPGIVMPANPRAGDVYHQEYRAGAAEDMARVISIGNATQVPYGSFSDLLMTEDWSPLDAERERKLYAPGIGLVAGRHPGGDVWLELIEVRPA